MTSPLPPTAPAAAPSATGVFVSFEGGDGVGKSTQICLLVAWLESHGLVVLPTREPGGLLPDDGSVLGMKGGQHACLLHLVQDPLEI